MTELVKETQVEQTNEFLVTFKKPYHFEGKDYKEIDLSGLEDLSSTDLIDAEAIYSSSGQFSPVNELSIGYTLIVAAKATQQPIEFFNGLKANEAVKVKNMVMGFLNS